MHDCNDLSDIQDFEGLNNPDDFLANETPQDIVNRRNMQIDICCSAVAEAYPYSEIQDYFTDVEITKEEYEKLLEDYASAKDKEKDRVICEFKFKKCFVFETMYNRNNLYKLLEEETPEDIAYYRDMQIALCCDFIAQAEPYSEIQEIFTDVEITKEEYEKLLEDYISAKEDKDEILNAFKIKKGFVFDD